MKRNGIKWQTMMVAVIPIVLMAAIMAGYGLFVRFGDLDRSLMERSKSLARQLAASSEYAVFSGNKSLLRQYVDAARAQRDVSRVIVYDSAEKILVRSAAKGNVNELLPVSLGPSRALYENNDSLWLYEPIVPTEIKLDDMSYGYVPGDGGKKILGGVLLEISKQSLNENKTSILVTTLLITIGVFLLGLMVAFRVAQKITRPILELNGAIFDIGVGKLDTHVHDLGVSELDRLAEGVNAMAQQLLEDRNTLQKRVDKATEELRQKKEQAEEANHDKSRFLAAASHDLRQPLHALGLFVDELRRKVSTPEQIKVVELIEESIAAMSKLLNSLLDVSKLDAGVVVPRVHSFAIQVLLNRMENDYRSMAAGKGLLLRIRPSMARVESDSILLERILLNLINNAIAYTPEGGRILVACRKRGSRLHIEVRDNGIGIDKENQTNIFREFFQLGNEERRRDKGLGLGLAIVDRLSRLLNHPVFLCSAPGRGSVFTVDIPLAEDIAEEAKREMDGSVIPSMKEQPVYQTKTLQDARVLVVDDDELVLSGTVGLLEAWGCSVSMATSVAEACDQLDSGEFDLLICDFRLADGAGLDVIRAAERIHHAYVPSILISGDTGPEVLRKVTTEGRHLLHKPVRPAKLRSLMLFLLAGNR